MKYYLRDIAGIIKCGSLYCDTLMRIVGKIEAKWE